MEPALQEDHSPLTRLRSSTPVFFTAAALVLAACEFAPPAAPGTPGAAGATAPRSAPPAPGVNGLAEPVTPARQPTYAAFGAPTRPDVTVHPIRLTTRPKPGGATWADLERDTDALDDFDPDVPVILQATGYGEGLTEPNGKASVRGKSTRHNKQKSYRIELKKEAPAWRGLQDVLLNKHPYDRSRLRNKFAFDILQGLPELPAPKPDFATLSVDGTNLGFYTQIERLDKRFLARRGLDDKGYLYQAEFFEFQRYADALKAADAPGYDEKAFERHLEIGGAKDHKKLIAMLEAVNDPKAPINATIDKHFDRANYVTWLALNVVMDNLDTSSQNFFLYSPAGDGAWRFLPWDYDGALGYYDQDGRKRLARWQEGPSNWWGVTLHRRFMKDPVNVAQLMSRVDELADRFFTRERVDAYLQAYRPVVGPAVSQAPDVDHYRADGVEPATAWEAELQRIPTVFAAARERFKAAAKRPMPIFLGEPKPATGGVRFSWDPSHDLQGDALTYDLVVARDPALTDVIAEKKGLLETNAVLPVPAGTYFYTVTIRDATGEWQIPFTNYFDAAADRAYHGVERFAIP